MARLRPERLTLVVILPVKGVFQAGGARGAASAGGPAARLLRCSALALALPPATPSGQTAS